MSVPFPRGRGPRSGLRGFTLIEFILVTGLLMIAAAIAFQERMADIERKKMVAAGQAIQIIGQAAYGYLSNNPSTLAAAAYTDVTLAQLQAAGACGAGKACLAGNFATTNPWGSGYTIRFRRIGGTAPYTYQGLVLTTTPFMQGGEVRLDLLGEAVIAVGAAGGVVENLDGTGVMAHGFQNVWSASPAAFNNIGMQTGQLAYLIDNTLLGIYDAIYLRTDGANKMMAALDMNSHPISNAQTVALVQANTIGNACSNNGVVSRDATGAVLSCQSGAWQPQGSAFWKDSVASLATLNASHPCNAAAAGQTRIIMTPTAGAGPRPYTCTGAAWVALAVDDNGNFVIPGTVTANAATVATTTSVGPAGSQVTIAGGDISLGVNTGGATNAGSSRSVAARMPRYQEMGSFLVKDGESINPYRPTCGANGVDQYFVLPQQFASTSATNAGFKFYISGTTIMVRNSLDRPIATNGADLLAGQCPANASCQPALLRTFCYYP